MGLKTKVSPVALALALGLAAAPVGQALAQKQSDRTRGSQISIQETNAETQELNRKMLERLQADARGGAGTTGGTMSPGTPTGSPNMGPGATGASPAMGATPQGSGSMGSGSMGASPSGSPNMAPTPKQ